jgi:hypothetical protein
MGSEAITSKAKFMDINRARELFWKKVDKSGDCWIWTANRLPKGYGLFGRQYWDEMHTQLAHRWAWFLTHGDLPHDLLVCHRCDNPPCVRPEHLFLGTSKDNNRDRAGKWRHHNQHVTHCPQGHEYTPENTRISMRPKRDTYTRVCRICELDSQRRYLLKKKGVEPCQNILQNLSPAPSIP